RTQTRGERARERSDQKDACRGRQRAQADLQRRIALHRLQVLRHEKESPQHHKEEEEPGYIGVPDADVRIETTPQTWAGFVLSHSQEERQRLLEAMRIHGEQARVDELLTTWIKKQPEGDR